MKSRISTKSCANRERGNKAFTLAEVVMSLFITGVVFGGILAGYVQAARRAEWSGYSLAAQAYGLQQLEQARAAVWDVSAATVVNEITNLNLLNWTNVGGRWQGYSWTNIDLPSSGGNFARATNYVTVANVSVSTNPPLSVYSVEVNTVWRFRDESQTNRLLNYYAPDL